MLSAPNFDSATRSIVFPKGKKWAGASVLLYAAAILLACVAPVWAQEQPSQFDDLAARAAQARDAGNLAQAIELYRQATAQKPDWQEGWWFQGLLNYGANQYQPAIEAFNHLLSLEPHAAPAMALRGLCEFEAAAYDDALRDLDVSVAHGAASDPRNAQILRYHLAQLLTRAGRFQDALVQYAYFPNNKIENADLDAAVGMAGMRMAGLLSELPAQDRAMFEAAGHAGYPLLADDSVEGAKRFQELFAQYPTARNLHYFYGFLLFPSAPEMAAVEFERELAVAADNPPARAMYSFTLMLTEHYAQARAEAEQVLTAEPGNGVAKIALGRALVETGEPERGAEMLKQMLADDPKNLEVHLGLVAYYARVGRKEDEQRERAVCLELAK
jgi:predicted Zn-dependent protease